MTTIIAMSILIVSIRDFIGYSEFRYNGIIEFILLCVFIYLGSKLINKIVKNIEL